CQGRTVTLSNVGLTFSNANDSARADHALVLQEKLSPLPGTQPTHARTLIDQIKEIVRKRQCPQCVRCLKLHPLGKLLLLSTSPRIREALVADICTDQFFYRGIGPGRFHEPAASRTTNIENPAQARRIC